MSPRPKGVALDRTVSHPEVIRFSLDSVPRVVFVAERGVVQLLEAADAAADVALAVQEQLQVSDDLALGYTR